MYNIKFVHNYSVHSSNRVSENKCNALNVVVSADLCFQCILSGSGSMLRLDKPNKKDPYDKII
jgi:hypothetical protein